MNDVQCLIDRQLGISTNLNYDNILKRLIVNSEESFYGLQNAEPAASFDQDPPIFACRFSEAPGYEHILALANEDGRVALQDTTNKRTASKLEGFQCHNNAVFDLAWMPQHMKFVTVSGDHTACLWDAGAGTGAARLGVFAAHSRSVKCVAFAAVAPAVFGTGGRDGHVLLWDARAPARPQQWLAGCHARAAPRTPGSHGKRARLAAPRALSVTGLAFRDERVLVSCGECDGGLKLWDLRRSYDAHRREPLPLRSIPHCGGSARNGYTNLIVDPAGGLLYASCTDDVIYCYNLAASGAPPERRYVGHENGSFYVKASLSPDGRYLASGSSDRRAYVWSVRRAEPLLRLAAHRAEVTCAAWRPRGEPALVTAGDDARHYIWRVGREFPEPGDAAPGRAEPVPRLPPWGAGAPDRSPDALRRRPAPEPGSHGGKRARTQTRLSARNTKRCLAPSMNAAGDAAGAGLPAKRPKLESDAEPAAGVARPGRADSDDWCPASGAAAPSDDCASGRCGATPRVAPASPGAPGAALGSPVHASPEKVRIITFTTPTKNLPNFVLDGEAPHQRLMSPGRKRGPATDWLTALVREKKGKSGELVDKSNSVAPLGLKENSPSRRNSTSEKNLKSTKKNRTILKYFSVKVKENKSPSTENE